MKRPSSTNFRVNSYKISQEKDVETPIQPRIFK